MRFKDRKGADFVIGPTHEEVMVDLVRGDVRSYRQLPLNLYQIQTKFRDELRARAGLMRGREFIMKDAYSFHASEEDAMREYQNMYDTYTRIFKRCGLAFRAVEADTGAIGGSLSHEFQVLTETGEDASLACDSCDYAANVEEAKARTSLPTARRRRLPPSRRWQRRASGRSRRSRRSSGSKPADLVKTFIYLADGKPVAVLVRGDRNLNEIKLKRELKARELVLAGDKVVEEATGAPVGFAGPVGLQIPIYCDLEVCALPSFVCGANAADCTYRNVVSKRDFTPTVCGDFRDAAVGDACPRCEKGHFVGYRGVEVGQVFFLGTKYSAPMKCNFLDGDGKEKPMVMGCYGIGVTRIAAAAIEQNHDKDGIMWPVAIAPFEVALLSLQVGDAQVTAVAERLYAELQKAGIEVLFDDRDERPGVKFKDADLDRIALPDRGGQEGRGRRRGRAQGAALARGGEGEDRRRRRVVSEKIVAERAGELAMSAGAIPARRARDRRAGRA